MCHHRLCTCTNACYWLGWSPERRPDVECSIGLAEGTEEDRFEGTSGRTHFQWRRPADLTELEEFHNSSGNLILVLNTKRWDWRPSTLCSSKAHHVATLKRCHMDAGHQGHDHTLSLLQEYFCWPGMANQMQQSINSCAHCLQPEGNLSKVSLHPIGATAPLDLLHVDITSIETTLELNRLPKLTNGLVFQDHFTKHVMVYVTLDQTAKIVTKFLYQVTSQSLGAQPGSWVIRVLSSWAASLMRCVNSSAWGNSDNAMPPTDKWVGGEITSNPLCKWLGSWVKTESPTGQDIWLK